MGSFDRNPTPQPQEERKERVSFIRFENGRLQMVRPKAKTGENLESASDFRINKYFNAIFSGVKSDRKKPHECFECFHCLDSGYIKVSLQTSDAGAYEFAFGCHCNEKSQAASVMPLVQRGLHQLSCQLAETCVLPRKEAQCLKFNCPRFKREER